MTAQLRVRLCQRSPMFEAALHKTKSCTVMYHRHLERFVAEPNNATAQYLLRTPRQTGYTQHGRPIPRGGVIASVLSKAVKLDSIYNDQK